MVSSSSKRASRGSRHSALSGFVGGFVGSGGNIEAGIIGALTGGIGAAAGAGIGGMLTRAAVSCVSSAASGGNCGRAALASGFSEWAGARVGDLGSPAANLARNAVLGGTASALSGGKFANGAVTGSFSYLFGQGMEDMRSAAGRAGAGGADTLIPRDSQDGLISSEGPQDTLGDATNIKVGGITGFTRHGINQAINRGVSPGAMLDAMRNPIAIVPQPNGTTRYIGSAAVVVINPAGSVVTVWGQ